jgi:hypothetical protein
MIKGTCRLCGTVGTLCKSHVIPEFCYAHLYDVNHRFIEVHDVSRGRVRRGQKGYWEYLLCPRCESHINGFERRARRLFVDPLNIGKPPKRSIELTKLCYDKLKLFFLSVLWRSGVSSLDTFRHIQLGRHEAQLRRRILACDPGAPATYGIIIFPLLFEGDHLKDFMVEPTPGRLPGGNRIYRFVFNGFVIFVIVSSHPIETRFRRLLLSETGPLKVYPTELRDFPFLREVWNRAGETTKDAVI